MNWPGYILSLYMLLLSVFPCCVVDDCPDDKVKTEQVADHQPGDEDDCGSCSPFFSCEGCASAGITVESLHFTIVSFPVKQEYNGYIPGPIPFIHYDFWQPPRLG